MKTNYYTFEHLKRPQSGKLCVSDVMRERCDAD